MSTAAGAELADEFVEFVQALGILRNDTTPCGQAMSVSTALALCELHSFGSVSQKRLAERLGLETSTVSRLVDQIERKGWANRTSDPTGEDNRIRLVALTSQGSQAAEGVIAARAIRFTRLLQYIGAEKYPQVLETLQLLKEASHAVDKLN